VLNFSDGEHSLLDIADRSSLPFEAIHDAAELLLQNDLLSVFQAEDKQGTDQRDRSREESLPRS
jgi:hypothetical protein